MPQYHTKFHRDFKKAFSFHLRLKLHHGYCLDYNLSDQTGTHYYHNPPHGCMPSDSLYDSIHQESISSVKTKGYFDASIVDNVANISIM